MKEPLPQPLNTALKDHYSAKSLSPRQSDHLLAMQAEALQEQESTKTANLKQDDSIRSRFRRFLTASNNYRYAFHATAALLLLSLIFIFSSVTRPPLSQRIMDEIAYNHQQKMPIEIASASLDDVRQYLDKLDFPIIASSSLDKPNWELLGGRYCSINGKIAAQLKIKNLADNNVYTMYQASIGGSLDKVVNSSPSTQVIDGVDVSIWREKGLLLGLASSP